MNHDLLNESILRKTLKNCADGMQIAVLKSCSSTNVLARELAVEHPDTLALLVAEQQTAGRGRLGRQFHSPVGAGVYASLLYPLSAPLTSAVAMTCATSVAVMRAIRRVTGLQTDIKWVNDLLLEGKKVCGILIEAVTVGEKTSLVIGVGINLRPMEFPAELSEIAGTLGQTDVSRCELIAAVLQELLPFLKAPSDRGWLEDYRTHSCVIGREILRLKDGEALPCFAERIDENGGLWIRYPDGRQELLQNGEVSVRFPKKN